MDYVAAIHDEDTRMAALAASADHDLEVPTCPGWTLRQLVTHVGRGHRWAAQMVENRSAGPLDLRQVSDGRVPDDPAEAAEWLRAGGTRLTDAVAVAPDAEVWTFLGPRPASWWVRRRLHEVTVHRADAALAVGAAYEIEPDRAADGVDEWLGLIVARDPSSDPGSPVDAGTTLALRATDADRAWWLRGTADGVRIEDEGAADATLEASAAALLMALTRRGDAPADGVTGDRTVWDRWVERTPF